jgi:hypothetical protein
VPAAVVLGASLFAVSLTWQVPTAQGASAAVSERNEIYRLINGSRAAAGKSYLNVDIFLEQKAGDGAIPCPDDPAKSIGGRAADIFATGLMDHNLRLCDASPPKLSTTTFIATMGSAWGYGSRGEILGSNTGYGTGAYTFVYKAFSTSTESTTGHMMAGWASSSSHWGIVMGQYNRVGCGVWNGGSTFVYACEFAGGSGPTPAGLRGAPRPPVTVRPPAPPATATPIPTDFVGSGYPNPYLNAPPWAVQSASPSASASPTAAPTPSPAEAALGIADATATTPAAGAAGLQQNQLLESDASSPTAVARMIVFLAGASAGMLSAILALLSMLRRRRETVL